MVEITFFIVQLVDEENDRFAQFFRVAEMILCTYFGPILSVEQQNGRVSYIQCGNGGAYKVIASRAVDDVQFLAVPS